MWPVVKKLFTVYNDQTVNMSIETNLFIILFKLAQLVKFAFILI